MSPNENIQPVTMKTVAGLRLHLNERGAQRPWVEAASREFSFQKLFSIFQNYRPQRVAAAQEAVLT